MTVRLLALVAVGLLAGAGSATAQIRSAVRPPAPRPTAPTLKAMPPVARHWLNYCSPDACPRLLGSLRDGDPDAGTQD